MPPAHENLIEMRYGTIKVRVWFPREPTGPTPDVHTDALIEVCDNLIYGCKAVYLDPLDLAMQIADQLRGTSFAGWDTDGPNAVQVTIDDIGSSVYYPEWP